MIVFGWMLNVVYLALLTLCAPLVLWRAVRHGRYRRGWREKLFGQLPVRSDTSQPFVWLHAVSVGEVLLLAPLLAQLRRARPELQVLVTTSTDTGYDVATAKLPGCIISWLPLDFTWVVGRALRRVRPDLLILVELELWPNLIRLTAERGIPLALVNARLSERSARGYGRIRPLFRRLLERFDVIAAQDADTAERCLALGAPRDRVTVTGSIKYDGVETDRRNVRTLHLRTLLGLREDERVLLAGSTQAPEELAALQCWEQLRTTFPSLRLMLVPRHRERFDEVATLVTQRGWPLVRRATITNPVATTSPAHEPSPPDVRPVILLDTLGELSAAWGLAEIAYVGGSLTAGRGGQNLLEPAAYGAAVLTGPYTENFRQIVAWLRRREALCIVRSAEELKSTVANLLENPATAQLLGQRAQAAVRAQQGATERTVAALLPLLATSSNGAGVPIDRAA